MAVLSHPHQSPVALEQDGFGVVGSFDRVPGKGGERGQMNTGAVDSGQAVGFLVVLVSLRFDSIVSGSAWLSSSSSSASKPPGSPNVFK
jgi:hypothetical protein